MQLKDLTSCTAEDIKEIKSGRSRSDEENKRDVEILREWLKKESHLPQTMTDDMLSEILYHCKYSLEKSKKKIDTYYSLPHIFPEYFQDRNMFSPRIQQALKETIIITLPQYTPNYGRVFIYKEDVPHTDYLARIIIGLMVCDVMYGVDIHNSQSGVFDIGNLTLSSAMAVNVFNLYNLAVILGKGYIPNVKAIHVINLPPYATHLLNAAKTFISRKIADRIYIHKSYKELHKFYPKSMLPSDYEGEDKSLREIQANQTKYMEKKNEWFQDKSERYSDESLRTGPSLQNDILGIQGSFKSLQFD